MQKPTPCNSMEKLNQTFINLSSNFNENIKLLTATCGQILGASWAFYNRLDGESFISVGRWNTPLELPLAFPAKGKICYYLIQDATRSLYIIEDLQKSTYAKTDPAITTYQLHSYIGHLVYQGDKPIGVLCALFDYSVDFSAEDMQIIGILARAISIEEDRREAQDSLRYKLAFEQTVSSISASFLNVASSNMDQAIEQSLEQIGNFVKVDRASLFILSSTENTFSNTHEWCAPGVATEKPRLQNLSVKDYSWWIAELKAGNPIYLPSLEYISHKRKIKKALTEQGIKSLISIPLSLGGDLLGFLSLDTIDKELKLSKDNLSMLFLLGDIIASTLERQRIQEALLARETRLRMITDTMLYLVGYTDTSGIIQYISSSSKKILGYSPDEMVGQSIYVYLGQGEGERLQELLDKTIQNTPLREEISCIRSDGSLLWMETVINRTYSANGDYSGAVFGARDVTERKESEYQLALYTAEIELKNLELEIANDKINQDIEKARKMHQQFLPERFSKAGQYYTAAYYRPAEHLGGDFYNLIPVENKLLIYLTDVTGHGLDGAMLTIFIRETINSYLLSQSGYSSDIRPTELLRFLFQQFKGESFPDDYFISIFVGVLDLTDNSFCYSSAGFQIAPVALLPDGTISILETAGLPLSAAIEPELMVFEERCFQFTPGAELLITSDGLVEERVANQIYGESRLIQVFSQAQGLAPELIAENINQDFYQFSQTLQGSDDITFLLVQLPDMVDSMKFQLPTSFTVLEETFSSIQAYFQGIKEDLDNFLFAVNEMLVNAMEHGNKLNPAKQVSVELIVCTKYIRVIISDEGPGFPWKTKLAQEYDIYDYGERGRGIMMSKLCCDFLFYNKAGNQVTLIKNI